MSGDRPSVGERLHVFIDAALRHGRSHLALLQYEWKQERSHILELTWRWALFAVAALTLYQLTAAFVVLVFWYTPWRLYAAGAMVLLTGGITYWSWAMVQRVLARSEQPFARSIEQFDKDREALERMTGRRKSEADDPPKVEGETSLSDVPASAERERSLKTTETLSRLH